MQNVLTNQDEREYNIIKEGGEGMEILEVIEKATTIIANILTIIAVIKKFFKK